MNKLRDTLRIEKYNGSENEDLPLWSLCVMAVPKRKVIHGVVDSTEEEPLEEGASVQALYTEKARMARAVIVTFL